MALSVKYKMSLGSKLIEIALGVILWLLPLTTASFVINYVVAKTRNIELPFKHNIFNSITLSIWLIIVSTISFIADFGALKLHWYYGTFIIQTILILVTVPIIMFLQKKIQCLPPIQNGFKLKKTYLVYLGF